MDPIDRRSLFSLTAVAFGGSCVPEWLAKALMIQEPVSTWRVKQLREAITRAKQANKPLLAFVVPGAEDGNARGQWFGAWLANVPDAALHLLSACELACATVDELATVLGVKLEGSPVWVLADVASVESGKPIRHTSITCALAPSARMDFRSEKKWLKDLTAALQPMSDALAEGVKRQGLEIASLAEAAMRRLDDAQEQELDAWFSEGKMPGKAVVALGASEVWRRIEALPEQQRKAPAEVLRTAIDQVVIGAPIAGARWMRALSCVNSVFEHPTRAETKAKEQLEADIRRIEEELEKDPRKSPTQAQLEILMQGSVAMCGRGYVPPVCDRFLWFWTAGD